MQDSPIQQNLVKLAHPQYFSAVTCHSNPQKAFLVRATLEAVLRSLNTDPFQLSLVSSSKHVICTFERLSIAALAYPTSFREYSRELDQTDNAPN